ncbi:hypothetical protein EV292_11156 [Sphingomonas sp. BK235]|nr:hypothetical protein EV292_11156 [Sphingomonas sp. BK235]
MDAIRHLLAHRRSAVFLCTLTLLLKLLVPSGYMLAADHGQLSLIVCSGVAAPPSAATSAMHGDMADHDRGSGHGKAEMPCAFAGMTGAALAATDPLQLAALIAFVVAGGMLWRAPDRPRAVARLRPPLRGPPAYL